MKRVWLTAVFALLMTVGLPVITVEPFVRLATTPAGSPCPSGDRQRLAQGGCCQGRGGVCGCSGRTLKCCNGTSAAGAGCSCRTSDPAVARF